MLLKLTIQFHPLSLQNYDQDPFLEKVTKFYSDLGIRFTQQDRTVLLGREFQITWTMRKVKNPQPINGCLSPWEKVSIGSVFEREDEPCNLFPIARMIASRLDQVAIYERVERSIKILAVRKKTPIIEADYLPKIRKEECCRLKALVTIHDSKGQSYFPIVKESHQKEYQVQDNWYNQILANRGVYPSSRPNPNPPISWTLQAHLFSYLDPDFSE